MADLPSWLDIHDDRFVPLVLPNAPLLTLGAGFAWLEGPVWFADADHLLVSDLPNDRILRWTESSGVSVFRQPSDFANGHARDRQGRLVGCSHRLRCLTRTELDGTMTPLATHFDGQRLNGPNDVVVASDGALWFTDPLYGGGTDYEGGKHATDLAATLYRLAPNGTLTAVTTALAGPNGLCFSPDERLLYLSDTGAQFGDDPARAIHVFDVADGRLSGQRRFHQVRPGHSDGLCCDEDGRVWSAAGDGVHCIAPDGAHLGTILTGGPVANLCFGGRNHSRLFICAGQTLMAIYTNVRGAQRP